MTGVGPDRRRALQIAYVGLSGAWLAPAVAAQRASLAADDGSPIRSFAAPGLDRLLALPSLLLKGASRPESVVVEFFDYNCGYCRQAGPGLDEMVKDDRTLRIVLVHTPVLSPASARAAEAVAAVLAAHDMPAAYAVHQQALAAPGRVGEQTILDLARAAGLDTDRIAAALPAAREAVHIQKQFALDNRIRYTPTFAVGDTAFIGWPGVSTMQRFVAATRRCGGPQCGSP